MGKSWLFILLALALPLLPARALEYTWTLLTVEHDSRDADMIRRDEGQSQGMVETMNRSEDLFGHHLIWRKSAVKDLLKIQAPFCEMHFDAVRPFTFTAEEKTVLREYFKRGGFILFFIDAYPYTEDQFWPVKQWPLIDFLTKELPATDPDFTIGRATDAHDIFHVHYETQTADSIRHELSGNPNTPNRTLVYYQGRLCCFVMGNYSWLGDDGHWDPEERPFSTTYSSELKSYKLEVNIYTYSIAR